jgi:hypothetical protein
MISASMSRSWKFDVKKQNKKLKPESELLEPEPSRSGGRASTYTFEVGEEICRQMAEGKGLRAICSQPGMPARTTVLRWLEEHPSFAKRYQYAREALMDWYSEEILRIAFDDSGDLIIDGDRVVAGHHVVQRARLKVDTVKWVMSKLAPKKYGDRPQVEEESKTISISWQAVETPPPVAQSPPKQIEYRKPELPADLTEADWSVMLGLLELVKSTIPSNDQSPPQEIFGIMKAALLDHFGHKDAE